MQVSTLDQIGNILTSHAKASGARARASIYYLLKIIGKNTDIIIRIPVFLVSSWPFILGKPSFGCPHQKGKILTEEKNDE
jgi:hypothetical protein